MPETRSGLGERPAVYALILGLSLPFWLLALVFRVELLPGLPLSALSFLVPTLAGILYLLFSKQGSRIGGILAALARPSSAREFLALLPMPGLLLIAYLVDASLGRAAAFQGLELGRTGALLLVFLVAALGEEFAWTGIFLKKADRRGRRRQALLIACLYCLWHAVPFLQAGHGTAWVLAQTGFSFVFRLLIVDVVYLFGFRPLVAVLLHASYNLAWQLYPVSGSSYDPLLAAILALGALLFSEGLLLRVEARAGRAADAERGGRGGGAASRPGGE